MRYNQNDEWELWREDKLLATRLEAVGKTVHMVPMSELLWAALERGNQLDDDEGFEAVVAFEHDLELRAANLHLESDLNDGVVLNIAPLWELVPWKEAKKHWDELIEGRCEWSSIGKQLPEKGMVKC
jgi:hypothetical protein